MSGPATDPRSRRCAGLLLAAGSGSRMGGPKALVPVGGRLLVERAFEVLRDGGCDPVVVVLGAGADEVRRRAHLPAGVVVENPDWADGQGGSLRLGLLRGADDAPDGGAADAAVIALVDQPGLPAAVVRRLIEAWHAGAGPAVVAAYDGRPRNPVLLDRRVWADVAATLDGDEGARAWLRARRRSTPEDVVLVECGDLGDPVDLDTPADLADYADRTEPTQDELAATGQTRRN